MQCKGYAKIAEIHKSGLKISVQMYPETVFRKKLKKH